MNNEINGSKELGAGESFLCRHCLIIIIIVAIIAAAIGCFCAIIGHPN